MSSLARGSLLIAFGAIYKIILSLLIDKFLAVELGVEHFGRYKYGITIVLLLSTFCTLGLGTSIIRSIAIQSSFKKKKKLISASLLLVLVSSIVVMIITLSRKSLFQIDPTFLYAALFFSFNTLFSSIYSGLEKPKFKVWINDIFGFSIYLFFLYCYFQYDGNAEQVAVIYLIYVIAVFIINVISSRKFYMKFNNEYIKSLEFREYVRYSTPLFLVSLLIILSTTFDKLILNYFVSEKQLGVYFAVFNIGNLLPLILTILVFLYLPIISRFLQKKKQSKAVLLSSYSSKWTMILASIFFGVIMFYPEEILKLLYSDEFTDGILVLKILAFGQWINVSLGFTGQNLLALGDSKNQLYIRTASFIVGIFFLILGAKYYGNIGAAISILISLLCSNILQIIILKFKHNFIGYRKQNIFALIIILFAGIVLSFIHRINWLEGVNFLILGLIDIFIFMLLLFTTKVIGEKDIRVLKITEGK